MFSDNRHNRIRTQQPSLSLTTGRVFGRRRCRFACYPSLTEGWRRRLLHCHPRNGQNGNLAEFLVTSASCIGHGPVEIYWCRSCVIPRYRGGGGGACTAHWALVCLEACRRTVLWHAMFVLSAPSETFAAQLLPTCHATVTVKLTMCTRQQTGRESTIDLPRCWRDYRWKRFLQTRKQINLYDVLLDAASKAESVVGGHRVGLANTDKYPCTNVK